MVRQQIDVTPNPGGDSGIAGGTKINANALLDDALQTATGIAEGATNIGTLAGTTGALAPTDTLKSGLEKVSNATGSMVSNAVIRHDPATGANRGSRFLGDDVDITTLTAGTIGTVWIPAGASNGAQYPRTNTLFEVDVRRSGDATSGASSFGAGALLVVTLTAEVNNEPYVWVATNANSGGLSPWTQIAPSAALTNQDEFLSTQTLATDSDWLATLKSGRYQVTYSAGNANGATMPVSSASEARTWTFDLYYSSATTGWVRAWSEFNRNTLGLKAHAFIAPLTRSGGNWADPSDDWIAYTIEDVADRSVRPVKILGNDWILTQPSVVTGTFLGMPRMTRRGVTCTTSAILEYPTVPAGTYFVDILLGNDANAGTEGLPYKTVAAALSNADCGRVFVAPGHYGYTDGSTFAVQQGSIGHSNNIAIIANEFVRQGPVIFSTHQTQAADWTNITGNVWERGTQSLASKVVDLRYTDPNGGWVAYDEVSDQAAVAAKSGTARFFNDGSNKVQVHTPDGTKPTDDVLVLRNTYAGGEVSGSIRRQWYYDGIVFVGGGSGYQHENNTGVDGGKSVVHRCRAVSCGGVGFQADGIEQAIFEGCEAWNNDADGFQYFAGGGAVASNTIELRCKALYNRGGSSTTGNGTSAHDTSNVLRIDGMYAYNVGPNCADVNDAVVWNVGCVALDSASQTRNGGESGANNNAGFFVNGNAVMVLFDCLAAGNTRDLSAVSATATIFRDESINTTEFNDGDPNRIRPYQQF